MAQNDTHVALIILTTQMWGGGNYWWKKLFRAKILCFCAFGANIHSYTKQRARHGTPFLQPPPPSFGGRPCHPSPPAEQSSGCPGDHHFVWSCPSGEYVMVGTKRHHVGPTTWAMTSLIRGPLVLHKKCGQGTS